MSSTINLPEIVFANVMGIMLCVAMLLNSHVRLSGNKRENVIIRILLVWAIISSSIEPFIFYVDGKPGVLAFLIIFIGNSWQYFANLAIGTLWVYLVSFHLNGNVNKWRKTIYITCTVLAGLLLVVNIFKPIIFSVSANNVYARGPLFLVYNVIFPAVFILDSICVYIRAKMRGGVFKFFPVVQFVIPVVVGIAFQSFMYGVSTIWPSIAISLTCVLYSLQNEIVYRDHLTGIYNRFYLDMIKKDMENKKSGKISAMMLDMNDFKSINDNFGHSEGDDALIQTARILETVIGSLGSVVRFAGDEFVVLLNTQNEKIVEACVNEIHARFKSYNQTSKKAYKLSASIGYGVFDLNAVSIDTMLHEIDFKMYKEKRIYYADHDRRRD